MAKFDAINEVEVDDDDVVKYVQANFRPEEVFPVDELKDWAECNGFIEEEE
jgi:hypothetical protein